MLHHCPQHAAGSSDGRLRPFEGVPVERLQVMNETAGIADTLAAVTHPSPALDALMVSEDLVEGVTAFAQKRRPEWRNR